MNTQNKAFMGIDVSKDHLDISLEGRHFKISNNKSSISSFIKEEIEPKSSIFCTLEATGGYESLSRELLQKAGISTHTAHPNRVHAFAKASGHFAKTDRLDAKLLEAYGRFVYPEARVDPIRTKEQKALSQLRLLQRSMDSDLHAYQCRTQNMSGEAKKIIGRHITSLKKKLQGIHEKIEDLIQKTPELSRKKKILKSFKGIGDKVANVLLCDLPELGTLTKKTAPSLSGLAPKTQESGKRQFKAKIQGGRFYVRKALYMSALVAIRHNERFKLIYQRLMENQKLFKVAIVAVMRKMIITLNAMIKKDELYA